jgi:serine protease Do
LFVLLGSAPGRGDPGRVADFRQIVQRAKERVFPAVVYVKCIREGYEEGKRAAQAISGSGVIVSPDGEIVTNWHVVHKATEVRCLLYDGSHFEADVLGSDKDTDLAVLRLRRPEGAPELSHAGLGDSGSLREGDFVMAMGAPWGMARSVSIGIVSATGRYLPGNSEYSLWLQTDASISPGNSGGPLVDTNGRVVGINTRAISWGGDIGFAIPSGTVGLVLERIRAHGSMRWSWTGLKLQPLRDFDRNIYFDATEGVIVAGTEPESPARRAGVQPRDRILRLGAEAVTAATQEDLPAIRRRLGTLPLAKPVRLTVIRDGETIEIELTPREKGDVEGKELDCPRWDFTAKTINRFDNPALYFHRKEGVFVYGVRSPGNARDAGLRRNDILVRIDSQPVKTLEDVRNVHSAALENLAARHKIVVTVLRDGLMRHIVLDFSRDYERE